MTGKIALVMSSVKILRRSVLLAAIVLIIVPSVHAASRDIGVGDVRALPAAAKRWALVVGVNDYHDSQITSLDGAANDARALAGALVDHSGFPTDQVVVLATDEPEERQPTRANVLFHLSNLARLVPKDGLFVFFFAGHGVERERAAYLMPSDARLTENIRILEATGIPVNDVRSWILDMGIKQVLVFLDACRNDPSAGRGAVDNLLSDTYTSAFDFDERNRGVEAFAVLYATAIGHRAYEYSEKRHGYFTWAVVEALKGGAANPAGEVTLSGMVDYIQQVVPKRVSIDLGAGREQKPFAEVTGYRSGELVLAKVAAGADTQQVSSAQLDAWAAVRESEDPAKLGEFVREYPTSPYADAAMNRMQSLRWRMLEGTDDRDALLAFYEGNPAGPYAELAASRVRSIDRSRLDQQAVRTLIGSYGVAYEDRDPKAVATLWPDLRPDALDKIRGFFRMADEVQLELIPQGDIEIANGLAKAVCRRKLAFRDKRGGAQKVDDEVVIRARQETDKWVIASVAVQKRK